MQIFGSAKVKFGDGAGIRVGGVEVALISHRTQALGTGDFHRPSASIWRPSAISA